METVLRGAPVAEALEADSRTRAAALCARGIAPCLAVVRVGENAGDCAYQRNIARRAARVGVDVAPQALEARCTQTELLDVLARVNANARIHGCLLLRPLPRHLDARAACDAIAPEKDMDCVSTAALARVFTGAPDAVAPCTAQACMEILDYYGVALSGARATVVGRSLVVGRPLAMLLLARGATVTICHSKTRDLAARCREADILAVAAGQAGLVGAESLRPGQAVLDVGIHTRPNGTLCGDVRYDEAETIVRAATPVPGGVGAVTTALLLRHVVEAAERAAGLRA